MLETISQSFLANEMGIINKLHGICYYFARRAAAQSAILQLNNNIGNVS